MQPTNCAPCTKTVQSVAVPGVEGDPGTDGTNGTAGGNAWTFLTADAAVPADTSTPTTYQVGDSRWAGEGQTVVFEGPSHYTVVSKPSAASIELLWLDASGDVAATTAILTGALLSPSGPPFSPGALPTALTDNSTGAASNTIAAGVGVRQLCFPHTFIGGTAAVEPVTTYVLGYKFKILSWAFITEVLLVGAAGSRVANMEIGGTDVGTVPSTITIPIANAAVGTVTTGTAVTGANTGAAGDSFSIEIAGSGTQFTAGSGTFVILVQNMDEADSIASLADHINDIISAL